MLRLIRKCLVPLTVAAALTGCGRAPKTFDAVITRTTVPPPARHRGPSPADVAKFRDAYRRAQLHQFVLAVWAWSHVPIDWFAIAGCETGGDWHVTGSTYSTGEGMLNDAIRENSPPDVAARELAGMSSVWEIIGTAKRVEARFGVHAWGCGRKLYP